MYDNSNSFVSAINKVMMEGSALLSDEQMHELSLEAATRRFLRAAELDEAPAARSASKTPSKKFASMSFDMRKRIEDASAFVHFTASGFELSRKAISAIPGILHPEEEQRKELGLLYDAGKQNPKSIKM
ncbi:hypothetical protein Nepgr_033199 [Nepenthes gracilis]|uniref:Uncharacterized protein n=1 Tax=Nepenthes gracilis TaxID=150966 RepID=A0AAD3TLN4_NEPGR|nr:hypothetical protein Nepgr_033199 [Nepenthes gracilis]